MPAAEVISSYHQLWQVEASFRMAKNDLRARPVFHHTRDAIEAHLTIVFAALAVARYLQGATGMSIKKIIRALKCDEPGIRPTVKHLPGAREGDHTYRCAHGPDFLGPCHLREANDASPNRSTLRSHAAAFTT